MPPFCLRRNDKRYVVGGAEAWVEKRISPLLP